ncbi:LysM peptidoglycan-binding domain-containing protein [Streptomyces sp. NPDC020719]|uniref:LysM peptidoglycan-binding domain-containing protein n=1 Tax=Streptomyces sp. NPDC020719 TaxID=3154896 RepID=UPI0033FFD314
MAATRPATRTLPALARALAALLALAVILVGLPWLLWQATGALLPGGLDGLTHLFTRTDTSSVALLGVAAIGWIGWLSFLVSLLVEIPTRLRGRRAPQLPGLQLSQRAAALLVGSILVLLPTSTALASPATAHTVTAPQLPHQASPATTAKENATPSAAPTAHATATPAPAHTYTVRELRPAESLWSIAEHLTGHGDLYTRIAAANEGRTMTDGTLFHTNAPIQPSWILHLPADLPLLDTAHTRPPAAHTPPDTARRATVRPGESLWSIAEREYHDGTQYPKIVEANRGKPQPTGGSLSDPDEIEVGWQLDIPAAPTASPAPTAPPPTGPPATPPAASTPAPPAPHAPRETSPPPKPTATSAAPTTDPMQPAPSRTTSAEPTTARPAPAAPSPAASTPSAPRQHSEAASRPALPLKTAAGALALLAAAVTGALTLRRILQRRRRAPGETIAISAETSPAAAQLAQAAEATLVDELDVALRTLAHRADQDDRPLPVVRAARLSQHAIDLLPGDTETEPQAPFIAGQDGWWTLPAAADLLDTEHAHTIPAPYPVLTTIGAAEDGAIVLLNLAHSRVILLQGSSEHIRETCTSLALELGMSPWAQAVEITTLGFGDELPQLLPTSRIAHKREAAHAVRDLGEWMLTAYQQPEAADQPYLLLCAAELDSDIAWQLAEAFDKAGDLPIVLVAAATYTSQHFSDADILDVSSPEPQPIEDVGLTVRLQRLEDDAFQQIAAELRISNQAPTPAQGPWQNVPAEPDSAGTPPTEPADPALKPVTVSAASNADSELGAFPALTAATTDPAALRLVTPPANPAPSSPREGGPDVAPASPGPAPAPDTPVVEEEEEEVHSLHAPEISVLGPVRIPGVSFADHGPRLAQFAALLYFKPGRNADTLCVDMDPLAPWSKKTLDSRLGDLRRTLGDDAEGNPYVPRRTSRDDPYRLSPQVRCDWIRFQQLAERALAVGPAAVEELERALSLVRGRPFGASALPWAEPQQQEMITRIVDVAHTVAVWRMEPGPHHDLNTARQAIATGLDVDESAELLYRDWMRIEDAAGNRPGLFTASTRLQQVSRANRCPLDPETEQLIDSLLGPGQRAQGF